MPVKLWCNGQCGQVKVGVVKLRHGRCINRFLVRRAACVRGMLGKQCSHVLVAAKRTSNADVAKQLMDNGFTGPVVFLQNGVGIQLACAEGLL